jgi:hypothetical protein
MVHLLANHKSPLRCQCSCRILQLLELPLQAYSKGHSDQNRARTSSVSSITVVSQILPAMHSVVL